MSPQSYTHRGQRPRTNTEWLAFPGHQALLECCVLSQPGRELWETEAHKAVWVETSWEGSGHPVKWERGLGGHLSLVASLAWWLHKDSVFHAKPA